MSHDLNDINHATDTALAIAREKRKSISEFDDDIHAARRGAMQHCKTCYYFRRGLAGQAFTPYVCVVCKTKHEHHNTNTPACCDACATEHELCAKCGGTLDMKMRKAKKGAK